MSSNEFPSVANFWREGALDGSPCPNGSLTSPQGQQAGSWARECMTMASSIFLLYIILEILFSDSLTSLLCLHSSNHNEMLIHVNFTTSDLIFPAF